MSAFLSQNLNSVATTRSLARAFTAEQILRGELSATTIGGANDGNVETFTWTIYLDEDTLTATSNSTLDLVPGNYDFELLVTKGNQQYAGYSNQTVVDGENDIAMIIKPIIGDVVSDVTIIDRLAYFKFQYGLDDIAALVSPSIGIQIDSDAEQIFTINTATGMSNAFVNISEGSHTLLLKLYDASIQMGKSVSEQENQIISYGTDLAMDIVPLHSELQFTLTENGGDANLSINIPAEVVNEVGGVNNLTASLALVGVKNPLQESALLFNEQADGSYQADLILSNLQYEDVALSLTFADTTTSDLIASCNNEWTLNNQNQSFVCNITLIRRAVINSNILAVLGLNVVNAVGEPVSGAVITNANGDNLGITGSGTYGTAGYLKLYLKAGEHQVTATDLPNNQAQIGTVTLSPLEVENLLLELAELGSWYKDIDIDGYGDATTEVVGIKPDNTYVADNTDCNDADININPGMAETTNFIDDDCDGVVDNGFKYAFVSKTIGHGAYPAWGSLAGANAVCQTEADAGTVPSGTYTAWLSDDTSSPATSFTQSAVPYVNTNGDQIAPDWAGLTDGSLDNAIKWAADGTDMTGTGLWVMTNTNIAGLPHSSANCNNYSSSNTGTVDSGTLESVDANWTANPGTFGGSCSPVGGWRLYCFQQSETAPAPVAEPVTRVFVTKDAHSANFGGVSGANAVCQVAADAESLGGAWKAWVSDRGSNSPAANLTQQSHQYALLDGTVIADDWTDLTDGTLTAGINIDETGGITDAQGVFTGTNTDGTAQAQSGNLCEDWTTTPGAIAGQFSVIGLSGETGGYWSYRGTAWCNVSARFYCFED